MSWSRRASARFRYWASFWPVHGPVTFDGDARLPPERSQYCTVSEARRRAFVGFDAVFSELINQNVCRRDVINSEVRRYRMRHNGMRAGCQRSEQEVITVRDLR